MRAVNLLPRQEKLNAPDKSTKEVKLLGIGGLAVVVVALGTAFVISGNDVQTQRAQLASAKAQLATIIHGRNAKQTPLAKWTNRSQAVLALDHGRRATALASALSMRVAWDRVLRRLTLVMPDDIWLTSLSGQTPTADDPTQSSSLNPATAPTPPPPPTTTTSTTTTSSPTPPPPVPAAAPPTPTGLTLQGYAYSQDGVALLLSRLQLVPDLTNIQLQTSQVQPLAGRSVVQFTIEADILRMGGS
jgi:Tfp pilus assembly protein PilN